MKYTLILLAILMKMLPVCASAIEVRVEPTGEVRVYADGHQIGANQIYMKMVDDDVTIGQRAEGKRLTDVKIDREGDEVFITGHIPGVASLVERVSITETSARFAVSLKFESSIRMKVYSNFLLYGLQPPFDGVEVEEEGGARMNLSAEPVSSGELKLLTKLPKITIHPVVGPGYSIESPAPMFLSDARGCGGFFYIGIHPEILTHFDEGETLNYTYEVSLSAK